MFQIIIADQDQHAQPIRELLLECLQWANAKVDEILRMIARPIDICEHLTWFWSNCP